MADKFTATFQVYTNNADSRKLAKPGSLFAYFIEAASMHAERLGIGHKSLQDNHNAFWALSKVHFEIYKTPVWHQKVNVTTWPSGYNRLFARRYFQIADETGTLLAAGASDWVIMSFENRSLSNVQSIVENIAQFNLEQEHLDLNTTKVQPASADNSLKTTRQVMYSDLDMNNHLTSMRYLDWALDCIDIDYLNSHTAQTVDINFMHETLVNENVTLLYQQTGDSFVISGTLANGKTSFSTKIGF
ncbi:MAG: hypothetical protein J6T98_13310 [Salinivirgaceae bacterium]|nr:hypothetical protein [Salinivirgaceae bacterium]